MRKALMTAFVACSMLVTFGACKSDSVNNTRWEGTWTTSVGVLGQTINVVVAVNVDFDKDTGTLVLDSHAYHNSQDVSARYGMGKESFPFDYVYEEGAGTMTLNSSDGKVECPFVVSGENMTLTLVMKDVQTDEIIVVLKKK
ncbi:MAG: hypothetical protein SPJ13_08695 [Bacteroidales bacterium]|nr:hypothetical protein [Bacteroidales bacterium]